MMQKFQSLLNRIKANWLYILIGLGFFYKGLYFFQSRNFFFYPPRWTWLMNNPTFDALMMFVGLMLVIYTLIPYKNNRLLGGILTAIVVMLAIIVMIEWEHVTFAYQIKLKENIVSNVIIIGFVLWVARHCSKR